MTDTNASAAAAGGPAAQTTLGSVEHVSTASAKVQVVLKEGPLRKEPRSQALSARFGPLGWQTRHFVLTERALGYRKGKASPGMAREWALRTELTHVARDAKDKGASATVTLFLKTADGDRTMRLIAPSEAEADEWFAALEAQVGSTPPVPPNSQATTDNESLNSVVEVPVRAESSGEAAAAVAVAEPGSALVETNPSAKTDASGVHAALVDAAIVEDWPVAAALGEPKRRGRTDSNASVDTDDGNASHWCRSALFGWCLADM